MQNTNLNKLRTTLAVLLFLFTIISVSSINLERNHQCSGDDCVVCYLINITEQSIKLLSLIIAFTITKKNYSNFNKQNFNFSKNTYLKFPTLISQKIRIND